MGGEKTWLDAPPTASSLVVITSSPPESRLILARVCGRTQQRKFPIKYQAGRVHDETRNNDRIRLGHNIMESAEMAVMLVTSDEHEPRRLRAVGCGQWTVDGNESP